MDNWDWYKFSRIYKQCFSYTFDLGYSINENSFSEPFASWISQVYIFNQSHFSELLNVKTFVLLNLRYYCTTINFTYWNQSSEVLNIDWIGAKIASGSGIQRWTCDILRHNTTLSQIAHTCRGCSPKLPSPKPTSSDTKCKLTF